MDQKKQVPAIIAKITEIARSEPKEFRAKLQLVLIKTWVKLLEDYTPEDLYVNVLISQIRANLIELEDINAKLKEVDPYKTYRP